MGFIRVTYYEGFGIKTAKIERFVYLLIYYLAIMLCSRVQRPKAIPTRKVSLEVLINTGLYRNKLSD